MFAYIISRVLHTCYVTRLLKKYKIENGFWLKGSIIPEKIRVIHFKLNNPTFVHLGDQLFYIPAMQSLIASGFEVHVDAPIHLAEYFRRLGCVLISEQPINNSSVLEIVPLACYNLKSKKQTAQLIVDFSNTTIDTIITLKLVNVLRFILKKELLFIHAPIYKPCNRLELLNINKGILFNNYVDSGKFRMRKGHFRALECKAQQLRAEGFQIIHVGSANDKRKDQKHYPYIDIDLRGCTQPIELIDMLHSAKIMGALTFDNFIMHASLMAGKLTYVRFRGKFTKSSVKHHKLHVNNAFIKGNLQLIKYI